MDSKVLGSILLIIGTTIGAGMLALPIATAQLGFPASIVLLLVCWLVMTGGAFLLLEVNLCMPTNSNLVTMARSTLGPIGQFIAWAAFLLLLYSLLCAYISGGSNLLQYLLQTAGFTVSASVTSIVFTLLLSMVVYFGIFIIDYVNRGLMFFKFAGYILLVLCLLPFVTLDHLIESDVSALSYSSALFVTMTSFGFAVIVPSLRIYLHSDVQKLKKAIFIGSLIPLICYIIWDLVIMGVIPLHGASGLESIVHSSNSTGMLVANLSTTASSQVVTFLAKLFTSICVLTSFLGVSLCLTDFISDGLKLDKVGMNRFTILFLTYAPPLLIVLFYPNVFIKGLEYAGIYSVILLMFIPAWMALRGRQKFPNAAFIVPGGNVALWGLMVISLVLIVYGLVY